MEALTLTVIAIVVLLALDILAVQFGVDTRDSIGDDHARPICS